MPSQDTGNGAHHFEMVASFIYLSLQFEVRGDSETLMNAVPSGGWIGVGNIRRIGVFVVPENGKPIDISHE